MNEVKLKKERLNDLFSYFSVVNIVDKNPKEVIEFFKSENEGCVYNSTEGITEDIRYAIMNKALEKFREKYCEAPLLIVYFKKEHGGKSALQFEMTYILNVRDYKKLNTILVSEERVETYGLTNESLIQYAHIHDELR